MASAWGTSWGQAWGVSWGGLQLVEPQSQVYGGRRRRRRVDDLDVDRVRQHWDLLDLRQASEEQAARAIREAARRAQDPAPAATPVAASAAVDPPALAIVAGQAIAAAPVLAAAGPNADQLARLRQDEEALVMLLLNF